MRITPDSPFYVDDTASDDESFYIDVHERGLTVVLRLNENRLEVDVFPLRVADQPAASFSVAYDAVQAVAND